MFCLFWNIVVVVVAGAMYIVLEFGAPGIPHFFILVDHGLVPCCFCSGRTFGVSLHCLPSFIRAHGLFRVHS